MRPAAPAGSSPRLLLALATGFVVILVLLPIAQLVETVLREGTGTSTLILSSPEVRTAAVNSVVLSVAVMLLAVPLGTAMALGLRRTDVPARAFWRVAVLLPVLVPEFVLGYSWTQAYGRAGFTDALVGVHWQGVLGPGGVLAVLVANTAPVAYLLAAVGLATRAEPDLERAAQASGAGGATVMRTITLPLLRPSIAAASVLVFVLSLQSFAVPQVMGAPAGFTTLTTTIYADLSFASDPLSFVEAVALALVLVLLTAAVVAPADAMLGPRLRVTRVAEPAAAPLGRRPSTGRWVAAGLGGYLVVAVGLPLLALLSAAITRAVGLPPRPGNWTLDNFRLVIDQRSIEALGRSVALAVLAASLLVVIGACVALLEHRRFGRGMATLSILTLALPGSTLAVALLITYGRWLAGSLVLILLAYLAKLWALAHRPITGALDRLVPEELYAARASGATWLTAMRTVALRPMAPALLGAWLVCFLTALHEVTMSSMLYGPGSETLAVIVLNSQELGRIGPTAALSVLLTLLMVVPALPLWLLSRRLRVARAGHAGSDTGNDSATDPALRGSARAY
ncbi:MAG: iron ABC transporter permease [Nocardioidaceae bacterium]|nr:iron ABC transporter permease [Nocardioidaceae bacterium]